MKTNISSGNALVGGKPAPGIALHGYDAVAYFDGGAPKLGDAEIALVHDDATYRFSSKANLDKFVAKPADYVPRFGGFCAFGASVGAKFDGDPQIWRIVDGRLYLNLSKGIQQEWVKDIPGNVVKANANWPALSAQAA
jgi:hypothetical protein